MDLAEYKRGHEFVFFTRQVKAMWDLLEKEGIYTVRKEYVEAKNDTIADFYIKVYRWYTRTASKYISIPDGLEFPIWLSINEDNMLQPTEDTVILKLEIPKEEFILCNYDGWGYVVNNFYVPLDTEDEKRHIEKLKQYGVGTDDELFLTAKGNFYPLLKTEVMKSWERIFTMVPDDTENQIVATAWRIKKEWVKEVRVNP